MWAGFWGVDVIYCIITEKRTFWLGFGRHVILYVVSGFREEEVEPEVRIKSTAEVTEITHFVEGENHG